MKKFSKLAGFGSSGILYSLPVLAFAGGPADGFLGLIATAEIIITRLIPIVIGLAVLVFLWGILKFILAKDDEGKAAGRSLMLWGIIALFVMVAVWGLVNLLARTLNVEVGGPPLPAPAIPEPAK